jgi:hypothetical protein
MAVQPRGRGVQWRQVVVGGDGHGKWGLLGNEGSECAKNAGLDSVRWVVPHTSQMDADDHSVFGHFFRMTLLCQMA